MRVELVSVGRELLRGRISDENARQLALYLTRRGAAISRITVIDDDEAAIASALRQALDRNPHLVVSSGGLGPAGDDRTLRALAGALGVPLALSQEARTMVEAAYQRLRKRRVVRSGSFTAAREQMCRLPVGSVAVPNPVGVSPGVLYRLAGGATVLCLPGATEEMLAVLEESIPLLRDVAPKGQLAQREIESPTADESSLRPLLDQLTREFPAVWISSQATDPRATGATVGITIEASGATRQEAEAAVDVAVRRLLALAAGSP